jgi:hypothetical protein
MILHVGIRRPGQPARTRPVASEITFLVSYQCPRCHAALEAGAADPASWLRCPKCGRASLPPSPSLSPSVPRAAQADGEVLFIGPGDEARTLHAPTAPRATAGATRRIAFITGLLVSSLVLVFALLGQDSLVASVAGLAALIFVGLLAIPAKRR